MYKAFRKLDRAEILAIQSFAQRRISPVKIRLRTERAQLPGLRVAMNEPKALATGVRRAFGWQRFLEQNFQRFCD